MKLGELKVPEYLRLRGYGVFGQPLSAESSGVMHRYLRDVLAYGWAPFEEARVADAAELLGNGLVGLHRPPIPVLNDELLRVMLSLGDYPPRERYSYEDLDSLLDMPLPGHALEHLQ